MKSDIRKAAPKSPTSSMGGYVSIWRRAAQAAKRLYAALGRLDLQIGAQ